MTRTTLPPICIRAIEPGDRDALMRFYAALSGNSLALRFHGASNGIADRAAAAVLRPAA